MLQKPLDQAELDLLEVIRELHEESGPFLRSTLSVVGRGRGLDVGRPLIRLKSLGLVEEFEFRPFFLKRLFGARTTMLLRPVVVSVPKPEPMPEPMPAPVSATGAPVLAPLADAAQPPLAEPLPHWAQDLPLPPEPEPDWAQEPPLAVEPPPPLSVSPAQESAATLVPDATVIAAPAPTQDAPEAVALEALPPAVQAVEDAAPEPEAAPAKLADEDLEQEPAEDHAAPLVKPVVSKAPAAAEAVHQEAPAPLSSVAALAAVSAATKARQPAGYTDDVGGQPQFLPANATVDADLLEGLAEMLSVLGMEMTIAGAALIGDRMAKGASAGEAMMQVILFTFAHAARYDMEASTPAQAADLHDYGVAVVEELKKLRDAGEISAEAFDTDKVGILALADSLSDRNALVMQLFGDPIGGSAPPALLPEELRGIEEEDDYAGIK